MGGDNVAISLLHIRLETLISLDKCALDKFRPFYGVFILLKHGTIYPSHVLDLVSYISNLNASQEGVVIRPVQIVNTLIATCPAFGYPEKKIIHHAFWIENTALDSTKTGACCGPIEKLFHVSYGWLIQLVGPCVEIPAHNGWCRCRACLYQGFDLPKPSPSKTVKDFRPLSPIFQVHGDHANGP